MFDPNPFVSQSTKKPPFKHRPQNFLEALKSIGGQTVSSLKNDVLKGTATDALNSLSGNIPRSPQLNSPYGSESNLNPFYPEWNQNPENQARIERHRARHREIINATPLYDRRQEETNKQIKRLQDELRALAKELANLGTSVQKAIEEEIASPGIYHLSFFEKLRQYISILRKQVAESKDWLAISNQRKSAQNVYWGNVKQSGTKFMLSHERTLATQTG
jgi:hypothetical protein